MSVTPAKRSSRLEALARDSMDTDKSNNMEVDSDEMDDEEMYSKVFSPPKKGRAKKSTPSKKSAKQTSAASPTQSTQKLLEEDTDIFESIKKKAALTAVVDEWITLYKKKDKYEAIRQLLELVLQASLIKISIPVGDIRSNKANQVDLSFPKIESTAIDKITESSPEDWPLISKHKDYKHFATSFAEFWRRLVDQSSENVIPDNYFLPKLVVWLIKFSSSKLRPLRHTSTFSLLHLCKALLNQHSNLKKQLSKLESQLRTEKRKNRESAAITKISGTIDSISKRIESSEEYIKKIWSGCFMQRWNDSFVDIRKECALIFGDWAIAYPSLFLSTDYLKLLGWLMSDDSAAVRLQSLKTFLKIYKVSELQPQLAAFCNSLFPRLSGFIHEEDTHNVIHGIALIDILSKNTEDLVDEDLILKTEKLISHDSAQIRAAVAKFALPKIMTLGVGDLAAAAAASSHSKKKQKEISGKSIKQLRNLLDFIEDCTMHPGLPQYVIEALWTAEVEIGEKDNEQKFVGKSLLTQWSSIVELLSITDKKSMLSPSQQILLAKILVLTASKLSAKTGFAHSVSKKQLNETEKEILAFTRALYKMLPELLTTFKSETEILQQLVQLPRSFVLSAYASDEDGKDYFVHLVQTLRSVLLSSTSLEVFDEVCKTLDFLNVDHELARECGVVIRGIIDSLSTTLEGITNDLKSGADMEVESSQQQRLKSRSSISSPKSRGKGHHLASDSFMDGKASGCADMVLCLQRLNSACKYFNPVFDDSMFETIFKLISMRADGKINLIGPLSCSNAVSICSSLLIYQLDSFNVAKEFSGLEQSTETAQDDESLKSNDSPNSKRKDGKKANGPTQKQIDNLSNQLMRFILCLESLLSTDADDSDLDDVVPFSAFIGLSHVTLAFSEKLRSISQQLAGLIYYCPDSMFKAIKEFYNHYMETVIDNEDEEKILKKEQATSCFTQMIVNNIFKDSGSIETLFPIVLVQFLKHGTIIEHQIKRYFSIVKDMLTGPKASSSMIINTLKIIYENEELEIDSKEEQLRALCVRLVQTFGIGRSETVQRVARFVIIHAIDYALVDAEKNGQFLILVLPHFVTRLGQPTAEQVLEVINSQLYASKFAQVDKQHKSAFDEVKAMLKARCGAKVAARNEQDEDDSVKANKSPNKKGKAKKASSKGRASIESTAVLKQGRSRNAKSTETSIQEESEDESDEQVRKEMPPPARRSSRSSGVVPSSVGPSQQSAKSLDESDIESSQIQASQVSVEVPLFDDDVEPRSSRPKRKRSSQIGSSLQGTQTSAAGDSQSMEAEEDDEEELEPVRKRRFSNNDDEIAMSQSSQASLGASLMGSQPRM